MLLNSLKVLEIISNNGFQAYIVGGFVRDYLIGTSSNDIDITTNATPKDLKKIFPSAEIPNKEVGSVTLYYKDVRFEITTYRIESEYINNRRPKSISYTSSIEEDVNRRDFTVNGLLMDKDKNIIDLVGGRDDLRDHIIRFIGNPYKKASDDALRILRAIRFATKLNFKIDSKSLDAIKKYKYLLKNISYERKMDELNKIFMCSNCKYGIKLIIDLGLDKDLDLPNLNKVTYTDNLCAIWAVIGTDKYPFNKNLKDGIKLINKCLEIDNYDLYSLYKYGLYYNTIASNIKGSYSKNISTQYNNLNIHSFNDVDIDINELLKKINKKPDKWVSSMKTDIEKSILYGKINNNRDDIEKYVLAKY